MRVVVRMVVMMAVVVRVVVRVTVVVVVHELRRHIREQLACSGRHTTGPLHPALLPEIGRAHV